MKILDENELVFKKAGRAEGSTNNSAPEKFRPMSPELKAEFDEFFPGGYRRSMHVPVNPHPVFDEFRFVQMCLVEVDNSIYFSPGQKREKIRELVSEFKIFCRTQNIRYRNIWWNLEVPSY